MCGLPEGILPCLKKIDTGNQCATRCSPWSLLKKEQLSPYKIAHVFLPQYLLSLLLSAFLLLATFQKSLAHDIRFQTQSNEHILRFTGSPFKHRVRHRCCRKPQLIEPCSRHTGPPYGFRRGSPTSWMNITTHLFDMGGRQQRGWFYRSFLLKLSRI